MSWFVYHIPPIDFGWQHLKTVYQTASELGGNEASIRAQGENVAMALEDPLLDDFLRRWESAKAAASNEGFDGKFRHDPVVFWIPQEDRFVYGFAFKQDNNGDTFVLSPVPLPGLDDD